MRSPSRRRSRGAAPARATTSCAGWVPFRPLNSAARRCSSARRTGRPSGGRRRAFRRGTPRSIARPWPRRGPHPVRDAGREFGAGVAAAPRAGGSVATVLGGVRSDGLEFDDLMGQGFGVVAGKYLPAVGAGGRSEFDDSVGGRRGRSLRGCPGWAPSALPDGSWAGRLDLRPVGRRRLGRDGGVLAEAGYEFGDAGGQSGDDDFECLNVSDRGRGQRGEEIVDQRGRYYVTAELPAAPRERKGRERLPRTALPQALWLQIGRARDLIDLLHNWGRKP